MGGGRQRPSRSEVELREVGGMISSLSLPLRYCVVEVGPGRFLFWFLAFGGYTLQKEY